MKYYVGRQNRLYKSLKIGKLTVFTDMDREEQIFCSADVHSIKACITLYHLKRLKEEDVARILLQR